MLPLTILFTILWGVLEVARPVLEGKPIIEAFRTCAFNYYPMFILIGMGIGRNLFLADFVRFFKRFVVLYAIYGLVAAVPAAQEVNAPWVFGQQVPMFSNPARRRSCPRGFWRCGRCSAAGRCAGSCFP